MFSTVVGWWQRLHASRQFSANNEDHGNAQTNDWAIAERESLLPNRIAHSIQSYLPPKEVTKTALRLRRLVEECVPCELEESAITRAHSKVITRRVVKAAREAGGEQYDACVVYCLLVVNRWFLHQSMAELWDSELYRIRAVACEVIAKQIIETETDIEYLFQKVLLRRYSILANGEPTPPVNVIEKAVDLHALRVICSSGYQKCISHLWRGWLVQDEDDPAVFVEYKQRDDVSLRVHLDPDRMRTPMYQNVAMLLISIVYLAIFTAVINTVNPTGDLDTAEIVLYIFTVGFIADEVNKFWKAGRHIFGFWSAFNGVLYALLTVSFVLRCIGLAHPIDDGDSHGDPHHGPRARFNKLSYSFIAFTAPMFWMRLLLYLDSVRFCGAMLVVIKSMMKESIIFFALLSLIVVGFLQAFIGLDLANDNVADDIYFIFSAMANSILQSPDFSGFDNFSPPFGIILYYFFTFIVMVILLNVLIALFNSSYEDIYDNANDEFLALFSQKTMQFIRAPDENVYISPFNLVEVLLLAVFGWWMPRSKFEVLNDTVMAVIYSPVLLIAAYAEVRVAHDIRGNRARGDEDDSTVEEWQQLAGEVDFATDGWDKTCEMVRSNVEDEEDVLEMIKLRGKVDELSTELTGMKELIVQMMGKLDAVATVAREEKTPSEKEKRESAPSTDGGAKTKRRRAWKVGRGSAGEGKSGSSSSSSSNAGSGHDSNNESG